jgi:phosphate starvation-inducible protein PhoH and related proteins
MAHVLTFKKENMATNTGKKARKEKQEVYEHGETFKEVRPLNYIQEAYLNAIKHNSIVFGIGSAGTGKTFIPAAYAATELYYKRVDRIIITRPNIEVGRSLGFLPGTLDEKFLPYLKPFEKVFKRFLGSGFYEYALKTKTIDPQPLGFMRGDTFEDCICLIDEAQNITSTEMKMLVTRIGHNCKMIFSGDISQSDIDNSGLNETVNKLEYIDGIEVIEFLDSDIVRSKMCKQIILAYNR